MRRYRKYPSGDEVYQFLYDKVIEKRQFGSVKDVTEKFRIDKKKSREILNSLVKAGRLTFVYEQPKMKIYSPKEIVEQIGQIVIKKPDWVEKYALPTKEKHMKEKKRLDKQLYEYERFEELLYFKNKPLEEPVIFAFEWLNFDVKRLPDGSFADMELNKNGFLAAVEVSGGNAGCPISEVRQLTDYYNKTIAEEKREIPHLILLFNHFNNKDLTDRKEPFAPEIRKAAERYKITLATTVQLYNKIRKVKSGEETQESISEEIVAGKWEES
jgi:hypothetical protein